MNSWIDISQPLDNHIAVWPGVSPFNYKIISTKEESGSVNVGQMTMCVHTGTHIDAPFHFDSDGKKVCELDINIYIGRARVIHICKSPSIGINELSCFKLDGVTRLLIRTDAWTNRNVFPREIPAIEPELASYLAKKGVRLLGLDLPSVDPIDCKELSAHHELTRHGIHILEGVVLDHIDSGDYELAALPLSLPEADGSPVRAVVRKI